MKVTIPDTRARVENMCYDRLVDLVEKIYMEIRNSGGRTTRALAVTCMDAELEEIIWLADEEIGDKYA